MLFRLPSLALCLLILTISISAQDATKPNDIEKRAFEQTNLAPTHPDDLRRMMRDLIAALERHHAVYPVDQAGTIPVKPQLP